MQDNLKDILSHLSTDIDQDTLLLYLQDKLSEEKSMKWKKLADNEFASDALDGLQAFQDKQQVAHMVEMLNRDLKKKQNGKTTQEKLQLPDQSWIYISVIIVIILAILSYLVIHQMNQQG